MKPIEFRGKETMSYNKTEQPTAEGAEEIAYKYELKDEDGVGTDCVFIDDTIKAMQEFATLHAQRIAEKMVDAKTSRNGC